VVFGCIGTIIFCKISIFYFVYWEKRSFFGIYSVLHYKYFLEVIILCKFQGKLWYLFSYVAIYLLLICLLVYTWTIIRLFCFVCINLYYDIGFVRVSWPPKVQGPSWIMRQGPSGKRYFYGIGKFGYISVWNSRTSYVINYDEAIFSF